MKAQKLSLHDFKAVDSAELLEVKGGLNSHTLKELNRSISSWRAYSQAQEGKGGGGGGGGGCGQMRFGEDVVQGFWNMWNEASHTTQDMWDTWLDKTSSNLSTMWSITKRNAEACVESLLPVAIPPFIDYNPPIDPNGGPNPSEMQ